MSKIKKNICPNFKPINDSLSFYGKSNCDNCSHCAYFSSRNCGIDIADSIETDFDYFL